MGFATKRLKVTRRLPSSLLINVSNDHPCSLHRQPVGDGYSDAFGGAGYHKEALRNPYLRSLRGYMLLKKIRGQLHPVFRDVNG